MLLPWAPSLPFWTFVAPKPKIDFSNRSFRARENKVWKSSMAMGVMVMLLAMVMAIRVIDHSKKTKQWKQNNSKNEINFDLLEKALVLLVVEKLLLLEALFQEINLTIKIVKMIVKDDLNDDGIDVRYVHLLRVVWVVILVDFLLVKLFWDRLVPAFSQIRFRRKF